MGMADKSKTAPEKKSGLSKLQFYFLTFSLAAFVALAAMLLREDAAGNVTFDFPGGQLIFEAERGLIPYSELLDSLFSSELYRPAAESWLRSERYFSIADQHLPDSLSAHLCDPIPEAPLDLMLEKARECAERGVARGFIRLRDERAVPFHRVGHEVVVGFPDPPPPTGRANACQNGDLLGKTVTVIEPESGRAKVVEVSGYYPCPGGPFPDLQIHRDDARQLLRRPLRETEQLLVVW